ADQPPQRPVVASLAGVLLYSCCHFLLGRRCHRGQSHFQCPRLCCSRQNLAPRPVQARTTFAVAVLGIFLILRYGPRFFRIGRRDLLLCALTGTLGLAGSNYFYYLAIEKATVAIAITLQYTAPVWVLITMVLRGRDRFTLVRVSAVLLALTGIALAI